jgi:hypothetical protein
MTDKRIVRRGRKSICAALDYSVNSWRIVKLKLKKADIEIYYEEGKPVVLSADIENIYKKA